MSQEVREPAPPRNPAEVLKQARSKILASVARSLRYTCVETVERNFHRPAAATLDRPCAVVLELRRKPTLDMVLRPYTTDRLRLDVTLVPEGEMYSWVGASHFENAGIDNVVQQGPIGSGAFAGLLDVLFLKDVKKFEFKGNEVVNGIELMEYAFDVPQNASHNIVKINDKFVPTAYSGTIWLNAATSDLVRVRKVTAELPAASGACQTDTTLDFGITRIGDAPLLLPTNERERFVAPNGVETENTTSFANCREYRGESTIQFDAVPDSTAPVQRKDDPENPRIPAGLPFTMELLTPIDTAQAAAGDAFRAKLVDPLRDVKSKILARAGSIVEGRLLRVQSYHDSKQVLVVMAPKTLWIGGEKVPLAANRNWAKVWTNATNGPRHFILPSPWEAPAGVFPFRGEHTVIKKGFHSDWWTAAPAAARSK
jgi:hypothetical protein